MAFAIVPHQLLYPEAASCFAPLGLEGVVLGRYFDDRLVAAGFSRFGDCGRTLNRWLGGASPEPGLGLDVDPFVMLEFLRLGLFSCGHDGRVRRRGVNDVAFEARCCVGGMDFFVRQKMATACC